MSPAWQLAGLPSVYLGKKLGMGGGWREVERKWVLLPVCSRALQEPQCESCFS